MFKYNFPSKKEIEITLKNDKRRLMILIFIEILCMFFVVMIQEFLRPPHKDATELNKFLLGTLPSFFAGLGYGCLFFCLHRICFMSKPKYKVNNSIKFSFILSFLGLTLWEIIRIAIQPFDIYDVIMTFIGSLLSLILLLFLYSKNLTKGVTN